MNVGTTLQPHEYQKIIDLALVCGFERTYSKGHVGEGKVRRAIANEAASLPAQNHTMVTERVLGFFNEEDVAKLDEWALIGAREIVNRLMANRACEENADELASLRANINAAYRRVRSTGQD